jgi:ABC-type dipeptide/oligopeptide/nickel transport system permease component
MDDTFLVYITRRLLLAIPTLIAISFGTFLLLGAWLSPLAVYNCRPGVFTFHCTPTYFAKVHEFHLKEHLITRWWLWAEGVFNGGSSYPAAVNKLPQFRIWPQVWSALGHTAILIVLSLTVVLIFSLGLGLVAATRRGPLDIAVRITAYAAWSLPAFLFALLLQQLFARLSIAYGFHALYFTGVPGPEARGGVHFILDWLRHLALPVLALTAGFVGAYSRYVRSAMLVSLNAPYATAARAKGISNLRLAIRHALPNSLIPFVNLVALDFGTIFGASLAVDYVYDQHGLASYLVKALSDSDPYEVEPIILVAASVVLLSRVVADLVTARLDPRARLA